MRLKHKTLIVAAAVICALAGWAQGAFAQGVMVDIAPSEWPAVLEQLKTLRPDKAPYRLTHRCLAYDEEILIQTPMARAAAFVALNKKERKTVTPEQVAKVFDPYRLMVEMHTFHRDAVKSGAVEITFNVDGKPVHPLQSTLITTQLRSVGLYAQPFYYATKQFTFDTADFKGAKSLTVVIVESEDKGAEIHELKVDLAKLK